VSGGGDAGVDQGRDDGYIGARGLPPEFLAKHHLPTDLSLYDEFNFLGWIAARKQIIAIRLQGIYHFEEDAVADAVEAEMPEEDDDLSLAEQAA
jgi:hypothetical protein